MKEFKGTPGPWSVNHHYNWIESENADRVVIVGSQDFSDNDANLIAAAPELLEALQDALHCYDKHGEYPEWDFARQAIKKALGE